MLPPSFWLQTHLSQYYRVQAGIFSWLLCVPLEHWDSFACMYFSVFWILLCFCRIWWIFLWSVNHCQHLWKTTWKTKLISQFVTQIFSSALGSCQTSGDQNIKTTFCQCSANQLINYFLLPFPESLFSLSLPPLFSLFRPLSWLQTVVTFLIIILYLAPSWHISYSRSGFYRANPVK